MIYLSAKHPGKKFCASRWVAIATLALIACFMWMHGEVTYPARGTSLKRCPTTYKHLLWMIMNNLTKKSVTGMQSKVKQIKTATVGWLCYLSDLLPILKSYLCLSARLPATLFMILTSSNKGVFAFISVKTSSCSRSVEKPSLDDQLRSIFSQEYQRFQDASSKKKFPNCDARLQSMALYYADSNAPQYVIDRGFLEHYTASRHTAEDG